jgi:processive 1,2-diacylglycerol beta-glucosyltransferase
MRILIISASAGAGHTRAGNALAEAARAIHPDAEVSHVDILAFTAKAYRRAYATGYLTMVNEVPALWGYLYSASDHVKERKVRDKLVRFFDRIEFAAFRDHLRSWRPDVILATHFLPCQVLAPYRQKGEETWPIGVALTDFDAHAFWVQPTADRFFVASPEVRAVLAGRGIPAERIEVTGIPIAAAFSAPPERAAAREQLGLAADVPTVLVTAGGAGVGAFEVGVQAVLDCGPVQVLAVAGRNEALRERLATLPVPPGSSVRAFGFVTNIEQLMAAADLAVAKSGGLTTSECLALGLPMVVRDPIPGQEERNADFVIEAGAGVKAHGIDSLRFKVRELLADPTRLARMRKAARAVGHPQAATSIVRAIPRIHPSTE